MYLLKMLKSPTPVTEEEKKSASAEMSTSPETVEIRPETDFHFFSDTEVTKYVICMQFFSAVYMRYIY